MHLQADNSSLEQRVATLEHQVSVLMRQFSNAAEFEAWIDREAGSVANDPCFDDLVRLGREYRRGMTHENEVGTEDAADKGESH